MKPCKNTHLLKCYEKTINLISIQSIVNNVRLRMNFVNYIRKTFQFYPESKSILNLKKLN